MKGPLSRGHRPTITSNREGCNKIREECYGEDSRNGGAAASAAANGEPVRQDRTVELVLERRRLESVRRYIKIGTEMQEQQCQRQSVFDAYAETQEQDAVNEEAEALGQDGESQRWDLGRWQDRDAVNEERWQDAENMEALR